MVSIMPVDLCLSVTCPVGSECQNGECISLNKPCTKLCVIGSTCVNGQCVPDTTVVAPIDRCALMRCIQGYYCQNGRCIPQIDLCSRILCAPGSICQMEDVSNKLSILVLLSNARQDTFAKEVNALLILSNKFVKPEDSHVLIPDQLKQLAPHVITLSHQHQTFVE